MKKTRGRLLSLVLAVLLCVAVLPTGSARAMGDAMSLDQVKALMNAETLYPQKTGYIELDRMLEELVAPYKGKDTYTILKGLYDWTVNNIDYSWDGYSQNYAPAYDCFTLTYDLTYETGLPQAYPIDMIYRAYHMLTARTGDGYYDLTIVRDGQKMVLKDFHLFQDTYEYEGQETYGYGILLGYESKNVGSVLKNAWYNCLDFVRMVRMGLEDLITGAVGIKDMSGPVGIVDVIADTGNSSPTVTIGLLNILYLAAFIAVNLAVMNLLPLPALDGGRVVCLLLTTVVEKVTRRHINPKYEGYLHGVGMVLLLVLMVYVSFQDVFRIIGG